MDTRDPGNPAFLGLSVLAGIDEVIEEHATRAVADPRPGRNYRRWGKLEVL